MRVTKLEHACLVLEETGKTAVIDPGSFTTPIVGVKNVVAVVITHEHADHWTADQLNRILELSPDAKVFGPAGVVGAASGFPITRVADGDTITVEPFTFKFFGALHEVIHSSTPVVDNVGVLVNDELYYAGDSYTVPDDVQVGTLAVPAGAPWLKIGDVMDFVLAVKPRRSFPAHEMTLSVIGKNLSNTRIQWATEQGGGEFFPLEPGQSLDL